MSEDILEGLNLGPGKLTRLHRMMYEKGPGNGKLLILPYDQGLEHGPRDFFDNPESKNPDYIFNLAIEGGFSAIAVQIGLAEKYYHKYAGQIPLVLKLNGKTDIPPDNHALSPLNAGVEDAVRLGADAVGYTLYVGSPSQEIDFENLSNVRREAVRYGMPLIIWSYPRGESIEKKGGRDSFYAVDYAARVAHELGADVIKLNFPTNRPEDRVKAKKPYPNLNWHADKCFEHVVKSAGKSLVIVSGGGKISDEALLVKVKNCLKAGAIGLIFGRNIWQRPHDKALEIIGEIKKLLMKY